MPHPVNELKNPSSIMEMKTIRQYQKRDSLFNGTQEIGSVGSSDTYASCNTQPFNSQGDLTDEPVFDPFLDNSNVYINPLQCHNQITNKPPLGRNPLRSLGASPLEEAYKGFNVPDRGSRGSLNDPPVSRNWKARFPKVNNEETQPLKEFDDGIRRRAAFTAGKSFVNATRVINQHLFGFPALGKTGKNGNGKTSISADSIDQTSMSPETHRRSKSILKKHDTGSSNGRGGQSRNDPEMEKLISDNTSGASTSEYSSPARTTPVFRNVGSFNSANSNKYSLPIKLVGISSTPNNSTSEIVLLQDLLGSAHTATNTPFYICPPPPPMEQLSNDSLLLQQSDTKNYTSVKYL